MTMSLPSSSKTMLTSLLIIDCRTGFSLVTIKNKTYRKPLTVRTKKDTKEISIPFLSLLFFIFSIKNHPQSIFTGCD